MPASQRAGEGGSRRGGYLIGLIGSGIGSSLSPALHEREADRLGVRYLYRLLDIDDLALPAAAIGDLLSAARLAGYDGVNVTHPGKQLVLDHLDELSPETADLGAANTVVFTGGRAIGHNTDWSGFARAVGRGLPDASLDAVVLLGAGGAGSAVAHAVLTLGAGHVRIFDLDARRGAALVEALRARFGADRVSGGRLSDGGAELAAALRSADGLVHATPTGMAAHPGLPVPVDLLRPRLWVADVVYRPLDTELVTAARERGCRVLDGGRMAVFQAADSFRLFTGIDPDEEAMMRHFDALVGAAGAGKRDAHARR
ncbi:shikimate dehydrogenase [Gandjariella thermophila]|uniref:Shikimate dehydrogenase (NADP(+)) n=1 Tax=Gandjariella thermophila TaxID=1931992 RepID=A0A4D4J9W7_9PSEU|nr:shikimate dehydrogenase [Gandjariella thermophila]GDY31790.1 shikimate dehydrogenase (NADP(+)) [Gandjariella thermophila]